MKEMVVHSIMYDLLNKTPVVILKEVNGDRYLPILIGIYEANAIEMGLKNIPFPRPMTHDLLNHILERLQRSVEFIHITHIEDSTFYASIILYNEGEKIEVDARPSDAIALAIRTKSPILVNEEILTQAGIPLKAMRREDKPELDEAQTPDFEMGGPKQPRGRADDLTSFRDFIDNVKPEDFFKDIEDDDDDLGGLHN